MIGTDHKPVGCGDLPENVVSLINLYKMDTLSVIVENFDGPSVDGPKQKLCGPLKRLWLR